MGVERRYQCRQCAGEQLSIGIEQQDPFVPGGLDTDIAGGSEAQIIRLPENAQARVLRQGRQALVPGCIVDHNDFSRWSRFARTLAAARRR